MLVLPIKINEEIEDKLATVLGGLMLLGVSANMNEVVSDIIKEGLDVAMQENSSKLRALRFSKSFDQETSNNG